ncbi:hypothetical protein Tco_0090237 [Tanacetum coccineum]
MSTQRDIYASGSKNCPPMLNKDNYVPWSSHLLCYAKSKPNGKLIYNSIMNDPYVRRMNPEPGDPDHEVPVAETFHEQTNDELTERNCETAQEIWLRVQQMMKGSDIGIQDKKAEVNELRAERLARAYAPLALMANSDNPYNYLVFHQDKPSSVTYMQQPQLNNNFNPQPSFNTNYMQQPMLNPKDITDPTSTMNTELVLMAKAFKLNYSTPTKNN